MHATTDRKRIRAIRRGLSSTDMADVRQALGMLRDMGPAGIDVVATILRQEALDGEAPS